MGGDLQFAEQCIVTIAFTEHNDPYTIARISIHVCKTRQTVEIYTSM